MCPVCVVVKVARENANSNRKCHFHVVCSHLLAPRSPFPQDIFLPVTVFKGGLKSQFSSSVMVLLPELMALR